MNAIKYLKGLRRLFRTYGIRGSKQKGLVKNTYRLAKDMASFNNPDFEEMSK